MGKVYVRLIVCTVVLLVLASCAGLQKQITLSGEEGENVVEMKADSFKFEPNNIRVFEGTAIVFRVENASGSKHNFTIKDPKGQILKSVDLPPKKITDIEISFNEPGIYEFYCDKPFHSAFGMNGQVEAIKKTSSE
jgi:uncharacterized cupredoxin-like copper-binding protein